MSDNLTLLQYAVDRVTQRMQDRNYAFMAEGVVMAEGGIVITAISVFRPDLHFPLVWLYEFSQEGFDAMLSEVFNLLDGDFDLEAIAHQQSAKLAEFLELRVKGDPELAKEVAAYETEREAFLASLTQDVV